MDKWADYFISEVSYDSDHLISVAIRHQDSNKGITKGEPVDRLTIHSDIINGLFYITIYSGKESWKKGHKIHTFSIEGNPYIRIDENKVTLDHLGDLPEGPIVESESVKELEFQPEQTPEPHSSPRGSLPKGFTQEHQEPEPTPEPPSSPRGSLPKGFTQEHQEPEPTPTQEPTPEEEESTPQQIAQLADLQQQIDDLEDLLSSHILSESKPEEEDATPQQIAQLDILQKQINELEKEIKKSKSIHIKRKISKPIKKSTKKLHDSKKKITSKSKSSEVYCRKCKTKRKIKNPKQTTMKNGKACVKGFCSVCKGKVFRVGKIKK